MKRQTEKLIAAERTARSLGFSPATFTNQDDLYETLINEHYAWDAKSGEWKQSKRPIRSDGVESVSIFTDENGKATGIYRLRLMAHEQVIGAVVAEMRAKLHVIEVSEKEYPNRRGDGVRVYLTCAFDLGSLSRE